MIPMARPALLERLATRLAGRTPPHPLRVAIDGVDAAGKTTLADALAPAVAALGRPVIRASVDGFHQPAAVRYRRGPLSPEGYYHDSFDLEALRSNLLEPLGPGGSRRFRRRVFDSVSDRPALAPLEEAAPTAVLLFDGIFLLRPELRGCWDETLFVRADFAVTVARARTRDAALLGGVDEVERRYRERYVPGQRLYLETVQPERLASVVVCNDDPTRPVLVSESQAR
jgi:uridine kinase